MPKNYSYVITDFGPMKTFDPRLFRLNLKSLQADVDHLYKLMGEDISDNIDSITEILTWFQGLPLSTSAVKLYEQVYNLDLSTKKVEESLNKEVEARKAIDGLSGQVYTANSTANYISKAINLNDADIKLDAALKTESSRAITQENTIEAAIGLAENGTHINTSGNYTSKATTITGEISALDNQVKLNTDAINLLNADNNTEGSVAKSIKDSIESLDATEVGGQGKVITTISETDGKISASAIELKASNVATTAITGTDSTVAVTGNNVESQVLSLGKSIKAVEKAVATYSVKKITEGLKANVKEAYLLVLNINGTKTDVDVQIPIYKDSSLRSVELTNLNDKGTSGQFLKFTYITEEGSDNIVYLDVSTFLVEAEFKSGLDVNTLGEVSIKIDKDSLFLSVSENGLKVSDVKNVPGTTNNITVAKLIVAEGGPLADLYKNALGKNTIDADITMLKLLEILFTKELWPTNITFTEGTLSASIAAPSFSVNSTLVEVGTTVSVSACTPVATNYIAAARKLSGLTYGYSTNNATKISDTSISVSASNSTLNGNYTITRTILTDTETKSGAISDVALAATTFNALEGSNVVKVAITGAYASCDFNAINSVWYYSNLGNTEDTHKTSNYTAISKTTSAPTNSKTITVTGVYPIYATKSSITSLDKLALQTSTTYEIEMPSETSTNKQSLAIYKGKSIKSILRFDTVANAYQDYPISDFVTSTVSYTIGANNTVTYTKYTRNAGTNGAVKFKITLS